MPAPTSDHLSAIVSNLLDSYRTTDSISHIAATFLPNRAKTIEIVELLRQLIFPGYFEPVRLTEDNLQDRTNILIHKLHHELKEQIHQSLCYDDAVYREQDEVDQDCARKRQAHEITDSFMLELPEIRRKLATDVAAAFDGDPASVCTDETVFCYPGIDAVFIHRVANALWTRKVPLLARIMSEYAHNETGVDIHPGATIGDGFFIDHGTGVVIGETCTIGQNVKIYQGVTLGALSTKGGQQWRGMKRHPTIEDDVTIYGGAIILGGNTTIGQGATIGGSVFITHSIPAGYTVTMAENELKMITPKSSSRNNSK